MPRNWFGLLPAATAVLAVVVAAISIACSSNSPTSSPTAAATAASGSVQPADAVYVHQVCSAVKTFSDGAQAAFGSRAPSGGPGGGAALGSIQQLAQDLVKTLQAATAPTDLKDYHQSLVSAVSSATSNLGQFGGQQRGGPPAARSPRPGLTPQANRSPRAGGPRFGGLLGSLQLPQPPQQAQARLEQAASADSDCQAAGFSFNLGATGN